MKFLLKPANTKVNLDPNTTTVDQIFNSRTHTASLTKNGQPIGNDEKLLKDCNLAEHDFLWKVDKPALIFSNFKKYFLEDLKQISKKLKVEEQPLTPDQDPESGPDNGSSKHLTVELSLHYYDIKLPAGQGTLTGTVTISNNRAETLNIIIELSDSLTEAHQKHRLEKIFVKSPAGIEIEVNHQGVQITRGGALMPFIYFDQDRSTGLDDVHLEIESALSDFHRKNGVQIVMPSLNGIDEIEFHVSYKHGKTAARFEVVDAKGLPTENVTGVIGEAIMPRDYAIDENGNIQVGDHLITSATVEFMEHDKCHKIPYEDVKYFYRRPLADYELKGKFVSPSDAFGRIVVDESPK